MDNLSESVILPKNYSVLLLNIISVVSKRGGFNPEEFKAVGELFEYVKKELNIPENVVQNDLLNDVSNN
tara:strand:- start:152 stop:358 length:207 start_codon:yes stop_codon:yes gene_type:complete